MGGLTTRLEPLQKRCSRMTPLNLVSRRRSRVKNLTASKPFFTSIFSMIYAAWGSTLYICTYGCESKRFGIEQVLVDIPFNTPFNTLLNRWVPIVQYPPFNTPFNTLFNTLVQYPCSIPLFNKYPVSILSTF